MPLLLTQGPSVEPVSLAEAKAHLRVDGSDEDTLIASLITSARVHIETTLGQALNTQSWSLFLDRWPAVATVSLLRAPVISVDAVKTYDADDVATDFAPENYFADTVSDPPRLLLRGATPWPQPGRIGNGIEIAFTAGYGAAAFDVPEPFRQAILMLVAHWFENREMVALSGQPTKVPATVMSLITPYRRVSL